LPYDIDDDSRKDIDDCLYFLHNLTQKKEF